MPAQGADVWLALRPFPHRKPDLAQVHELLCKDAASMEATVDEGAQKRIEGFKRQQQREMEGLRTRIERGRAEHKNHWAQGAARLMQSHKNMATDLRLRQSLEANKVRVAIQTMMPPVVKSPPSPRGGRMPKQAYGPLPQRPSKLPVVV